MARPLMPYRHPWTYGVVAGVWRTNGEDRCWFVFRPRDAEATDEHPYGDSVQLDVATRRRGSIKLTTGRPRPRYETYLVADGLVVVSGARLGYTGLENRLRPYPRDELRRRATSATAVEWEGRAATRYEHVDHAGHVVVDDRTGVAVEDIGRERTESFQDLCFDQDVDESAFDVPVEPWPSEWREGIAHVSPSIDETGFGATFELECGPSGHYVIGPDEVELDEALAWARDRCDRVVLRLGNEDPAPTFSAGVEPIAGMPVWTGS